MIHSHVAHFYALAAPDFVLGPTSDPAKRNILGLIKKGKVVSEGLLNMVEMAFRAYDPCMACATHTLPGQMPLEIVIYNSKGEVAERLSRL
ncbi:unnamed protein product [marine sediment metagenome]|uniref:Uncharacterized protein n=1 Tax=marine sediment metagenome TaxID=412755 RepID=X1GHK5_9ZZZZ